MNLQLDNYKTIKDLMEELQISRKTVYNWIDSGKIESKKVLDRTVVRLIER